MFHCCLLFADGVCLQGQTIFRAKFSSITAPDIQKAYANLGTSVLSRVLLIVVGSRAQR